MTLFFILRLTKYEQRRKGASQLADQIQGQLTEFEKQLIKTQEVVETKGKVSHCNNLLAYLVLQKLLYVSCCVAFSAV